MSKFFGTDGVRGVANRELTCELAIKIGKAAAEVLTGNCKHKPKILIGKDTRISSDMLEFALLAGICSVGAEGISLGVVPTPAVAYLVKKYNADAGIMISASHNSYEFNGIKIFDKNGHKLPDKIEEQIESIILDGSHGVSSPIGEDLGKVSYCKNSAHEYVEYIASTLRFPVEKSLKIVVDCANGSASTTVKSLFEKIGADVKIIFDNPDGININHNCGSTNLNNLSDYVVKNKYDLGIAFDGDADRCLFVDEKGGIIDGDTILAICADSMKKEGTLKKSTLVGTIVSNAGLKKFCKNNNINFCETKVGDRYVLEKMMSEGYNIGGEQSGHVIFLDFSTTGDGQLTAVQFLSILSKSGKKASALNELVKKYPQKSDTITIEPHQKGLVLKNKSILDHIKSLEEDLGDTGRIIVRESGTEPKIRVMVECENEDKLDELVKSASQVIYENLNLRKVGIK